MGGAALKVGVGGAAVEAGCIVGARVGDLRGKRCARFLNTV